VPPHAVRWIREQAYFLLVLAALLAGFGYLLIGPGHWRRSVFVMGCAMVLAAGLRIVLPNARAGLLAVRGKWLDTGAYLVSGVLVLVLDIRLHR